MSLFLNFHVFSYSDVAEALFSPCFYCSRKTKCKCSQRKKMICQYWIFLSPFSPVLPAFQEQDVAHALTCMLFSKSFSDNCWYHYFHCLSCLFYFQGLCLCMLNVSGFTNAGYFDNLCCYCIFCKKPQAIKLLFQENIFSSSLVLFSSEDFLYCHKNIKIIKWQNNSLLPDAN